MTILFAVFLVVHGLIHLLFVGNGLRLFELESGLTWPDGSWLFSRLIGDGATRVLAAVFGSVATLAFVGAGVGVLLKQGWWHPVTIAAAIGGSAFYLVLWDGSSRKLGQQGVFAITINVAILLIVLGWNWPSFDS